MQSSWSKSFDCNPESVIPQGYQVLLSMRRPREMSEGGIALAVETQRNEQMLEQVGQVVSMGPLAYTHPKFDGHRYCDIGDYVLVGQYAGVAVPMSDGSQLRLIDDDQIKAVVPNPDSIRKQV